MSMAVGVVRSRDHRVSRSDHDVRDRLSAAIVVLVYLVVVVPAFVQSMTAPKTRASIGLDSAPYTPLTSLTRMSLTLLLMATCLIAVLITLSAPRPTPLMPLTLVLAPWGYLVIRDLFLGVQPEVRVFIYPLVAVALWQLQPGRRLLVVVGYLVGISAVLAVLMGVLVPAKGLFQAAGGGLVTEDKQLAPIGILVGFLTHGNSLGVFIGLGIPFIAAIHRPWHRYVLLALSIAAVLWSSSRSAIGGVVVVAIVAVALVSRDPVRRRIIATAAIIICALPIVLLPLLVRNPEAFTNRGLIWAQSLLWFRESPWIGLGSDWYAVVGSSSARLAATVFHGHNELVQVLVTGGVVLAALVALMVARAAISATYLVREGVSSLGVLFLVGLAINCAVEAPLAIVDNFGLFPATTLPLLVLLFTDGSRAADMDPGDEAAAVLRGKTRLRPAPRSSASET